MLLRPETNGFSVYMTRRSSHSRFMPDAYVFPGGAVDPGDGEPALLARLHGPPHAAGPNVAVAALRELLEEAGVLIACGPGGAARTVEPAVLATLRAELARGEPFVSLLRRYDLHLNSDALAYYSNWITPEGEPIRFDTHFFVAHAPPRQIAAADAVEVHDGVWLAPADALARGERNEMTIRFPTRKHLERLAAFEDVDSALAHARQRSIRPIMPVLTPEQRISFEGPDPW